MPRRFVLPKIIYVPFAAAFFFAALAGIWITWLAQIENYRFGSAVDEIRRIVTQAREMKVKPDMNAALTQKLLVDNLVAAGHKTTTIEEDGRGGGSRALSDPWGKPIKFVLYPSANAIRLELALSPIRCRKFLALYAKDPASLGLLRLETMTDPGYALWLPVYEKGKDTGIKTQANACGAGQETLVSLIFSLS